MSGTKRRGTTLLELTLVVAILTIIALPFAAFVSQNLKNSLVSSEQLKEQMVLEQVMQDLEKHLRSATSTSSAINVSTANRIAFSSQDPTTNTSFPPTVTAYVYELRSDGLFYKNNAVFPDGLEANTITSLAFPTGSGQQQLNPAASPCWITVRIDAYDTMLQTTTSLQKTIYLYDY
jgi:Tfp pilus assembly protein PilE